jgi:hypothetical protein
MSETNVGGVWKSPNSIFKWALICSFLQSLASFFLVNFRFQKKTADIRLSNSRRSAETLLRGGRQRPDDVFFGRNAGGAKLS